MDDLQLTTLAYRMFFVFEGYIDVKVFCGVCSKRRVQISEYRSLESAFGAWRLWRLRAVLSRVYDGDVTELRVLGHWSLCLWFTT